MNVHSFFGDVAVREMSLLCLTWLRRQLSWQTQSVMAMPHLQAKPGLNKPEQAHWQPVSARDSPCSWAEVWPYSYLEASVAPQLARAPSKVPVNSQ